MSNHEYYVYKPDGSKVSLYDYVPTRDRGDQESETSGFSPYSSVSSKNISSPTTKDQDLLARKIYEMLKRAGYSKAASCGVLGNIYQESGFSTECVGDQGKSYGLFQKNYSTVKSYANSVNGSLTSYEVQVNQILSEVKGDFSTYTGRSQVYTYSTGETVWLTESVSIEDFKNSADPELAAYQFCKVVERPSIQRIERRQAKALYYYKNF